MKFSQVRWRTLRMGRAEARVDQYPLGSAAVSRMYRAPSVSCSGYYEWRVRMSSAPAAEISSPGHYCGPCAHPAPNAHTGTLLQAVSASYITSTYFYQGDIRSHTKHILLLPDPHLTLLGTHFSVR
jgi:hypothetical protein